MYTSIKILCHLILLLISFSSITAQHIDLYDSNGDAKLYIDEENSNTIFTWSGKPLAYLEYQDNRFQVFGFNGTHLGYYVSGRIYDQDGYVLLFKENVYSNIRLNRAERKNRQERVPSKERTDRIPREPRFIDDEISPYSPTLYLSKGKSEFTSDFQRTYGVTSPQIYSGSRGVEIPDVELENTLEAPDFSSAIESASEVSRKYIERENARLDKVEKYIELGLAAETAEERERYRILAENTLNAGKHTNDINEKLKYSKLKGDKNIFKVKKDRFLIYPDYKNKTSKKFEIKGIKLSKKETVIRFKYLSRNSHKLIVPKDILLTNDYNDKQYRLIGYKNLKKDLSLDYPGGEVVEFSLVFESLGKNCKVISIRVNGKEKYLEFSGIQVN